MDYLLSFYVKDLMKKNKIKGDSFYLGVGRASPPSPQQGEPHVGTEGCGFVVGAELACASAGGGSVDL